MAGQASSGFRLFCLGIICLILMATVNAVRADDVSTVTVESRRDHAKLEQQVNSFVASALVRPYSDESLPRWDHPMCPLVAGLPRAAGEFVLARLSQIARAAHAPLGSEKCKPNLFVIVARNPERFLRLWWHRNPALFDTHFGIAPVRRFIETSRPVRVWYNAGMTGGEEGSLFSGMLAMSADAGLGMTDYPVLVEPSTLGSRLTYPAVRAIDSVIIVIDPSLVSTLNIGQLTDYVGLVGLSQINLDKDLGDVPTILRVFGAGGPPPIEMTAWDRALLQSLYTTTQRSRVQLSQMQTTALKLIAQR
jgi:hypothetical protein